MDAQLTHAEQADLRSLVKDVCERLDIKPSALLGSRLYSVDRRIRLRGADRDYDPGSNWLKNALYRKARPLTAETAQELFVRTMRLCKKHQRHAADRGGLGRRTIIRLSIWRKRLFGELEAAAILLFPGEAARAAADLLEHFDAEFEARDAQRRAWRTCRSRAAEVLDEYFARYERLGRKALSHGAPIGVYASELRPRCASSHTKRQCAGAILELGVKS